MADTNCHRQVFFNRQKENRPKRDFQSCLHLMEDRNSMTTIVTPSHLKGSMNI